MRVLVYGAGGVGLGLGSFLLQAGAELRFVGRPGTTRALGRCGLERRGLFGTYLAPASSFAAFEELATAADRFPTDFILVATKAFDSEAAARDLAASDPAFGEGCPIVLCQNGWGNAEVFTRHFDSDRVWNARVITGFARPEPWRVEVTAHAEPIAMGSLFHQETARLEPLCQALRSGGLPAETTPRIAEALWAKLLYNGCLNPLGAILGAPYGALGRSEHGRRLIAATAAEIFAVMTAAGFRSRWSSAAAFLESLYRELLPPTAAHESSTLQDLRAGKRTEIDALNGAVVRLAEAHGLAVPVNAALCDLVRFLEALGRGGSGQR
jgi:2-dehydropantoate 2-reductase